MVHKLHGLTRIKFYAKIFFFFSFFIVNYSLLIAQDFQGKIIELTGNVEIKTSDSQEFVNAQIGDILDQNTIISTSFKSMAVIEIGSTSIIVRPITRLTLLELSSMGNTETLNINLQSGRVRIDVKPPAGTRSSFSVQSPMSVASVRGTSFEFDTRNLYVSNGTVDFTGNRGQQVKVQAGEAVRITNDGSASTPTEEKIINLMPPLPIGIEIIGTTGGGSGTGVIVAIHFNF